ERGHSYFNQTGHFYFNATEREINLRGGLPAAPQLPGEVMAFPISTRRGRRYLGNTNKKEVYDLKNEKPQCQVDEIIEAGHAVGFHPDTLEQAHAEGYDNGAYCLGGSTR
ncbi:MAG: hypothetical protein ACE5GJ_14950, partial [Gemmatimonadota bacterium]